MDNNLYINFNKDLIEKNVMRLINQLWKLIPMRENNEDWKKQLNTVIIEIAGLGEVLNQDPQFLQLISKLKGLEVVETDFPTYRKTVFEAIELLKQTVNQTEIKPKDLKLVNLGLRLMAGRGNYISNPQYSSNEYTPEGIVNNSQRLLLHGGFPQQDRMIRDKRRSLDKAVLYSYQGAFVKKVLTEDVLGETLDYPPVRALINPNKLKQDYDDKIISIGFEHHFEAGTVFQWCNTNSYWLVYLQDLDELAYFRGDIRRCRYQINWLDEDGNEHSTYAAIRGPVETKINFIQKHQISVDEPNHSLNILMPLTPYAKKYFTRYSKFYLQGNDVCWRVEASDWISTPGILEINAVEYYSNETEDDKEKGLVGGLIVKDVNENTPRIDRLIAGEVFIKPKRNYTYTYTGLDSDGEWLIDDKYPIEYNIDGNSITIKWLANYSGQFDLKYKDLSKTIVVESLF